MSECMGTGKKVQILLSTYNGERYLREQLDSFLALDNFQDCMVLIRDDGSADKTPSILQEYATRYGFQVEFGENIGVNASYQWLIEHSSPYCTFFAFSDQDDVWLPFKLTLAVSALEAERQNQMLLFASRSTITDENLQTTGYAQLPQRGISFYNAMVQNVLPGHTQVFNRRLRDSLACHNCLDAHVIDWWLYLTAASLGKILYSEKCTVLHRQHYDNAVGYPTMGLERLKRRLAYIRDGKGNAISFQLKAFWDRYEEELPYEYREELSAYLVGLASFPARLGYLRHGKVFRQKPAEDILFRLLYLFGKYCIRSNDR